MSGIYNHRCRRCGLPIRIAWQGWNQRTLQLRGVYVDETEGDVCCADEFMENNENGRHQI